MIYEGTPDSPEKGRWWKIVAGPQGLDLLHRPTAIRSFMKQGQEIPDKYDMSSLRVLGSVGEPINPEAYVWYRHVIGGDRAGRRHLVADRDRRDHDQPAARRHRRASRARR